MSVNDSASNAQEPADPRASLALAITNAVPVLFAYVDRDERYRFVNRAYEAWFGLPHDQIVGQRLVDLLGEAAYVRSKPFVDRALAGETVVYDGELAYERAGFRHIEALFTPDIAADGAVLGYHIMVSDISLRKQGERELNRLLSQERRRAVLLELARELREETHPKALADRACEVLAHTLGASRIGYAEIDPDGVSVKVVSEWAVEGFASLEGSVQTLDEFGPQMAADLRAARAIVIPDIAADPRTATASTG